jgi:multidrug efflux pump subunit AcrB
MRLATLSSTVLLAAAALLPLAACASTPIQQTTDTSRAMAEVGDALKRLVPSLEQTSGTLDLVGSVAERGAASELPDLLRRFTREVEQSGAAFTRAERTAAAATRTARAYLDQRQKTNAEITDPSLRSIDEQRIEGMREQLKAAQAAFETVKQSFEPVAANLGSLQKYLESNLTADGIKAAEGQIASIADAVRDFKPQVDACIATFEKLSGSMVPPKSS